jgi:hypothetical protein
MKQHGLAPRRSVLQGLPPVTHELPHVGLCSAELPDLLPKRSQLLFCKVEHAPAWDAAVVACSQDLRKFVKREPQLERPLGKLYALNGGCREYPITAVRPL